jgi:hypothetical protein
VKRRLRLAVAAIVCVFLFWLGFVHYTEAHQVAIMWNKMTGEVTLDETGGFTFSPPWVFVSRIDIRPHRVCVTTTARTINCKVVRFQSEEYREFVAVQGFRYYWLANRLSYNSGYETYRGMRDILRGFAFSEKQYPFILVADTTKHSAP